MSNRKNVCVAKKSDPNRKTANIQIKGHPFDRKKLKYPKPKEAVKIIGVPYIPVNNRAPPKHQNVSDAAFSSDLFTGQKGW